MPVDWQAWSATRAKRAKSRIPGANSDVGSCCKASLIRSTSEATLIENPHSTCTQVDLTTPQKLTSPH